MSQSANPNAVLGATAHWMASVRAAESARDDRLFHDPWAEALAGEVGAQWLSARTAESLTPMVLRTRYFDEALERTANRGGIRQFVLLGAGLDTRAYRLMWPEGTKLFELDQADVLERKARVLEQARAVPSCERHSIATDLAAGWKDALLQAGFTAEQPSGWLLEGLLFYLPNQVSAGLLETISELAAPGSWLGFDVINNLVLTSPYTRAWVEMQAQLGAPWIGTMDDPEACLTARGWQVSLTQAGQPEVNHGRWKLPVLPVRMPDMPHNWLVTAQKR